VKDYESVLRLFDRTWFTRLWIIQEAVLAKNTTCISGSHQIEWAELGKAAVWIIYKAANLKFGDGSTLANHQGLHNVCRLTRKVDIRMGFASSPPHLSRMIWETLNFSVTEPHDRIFALLGLTKWGTDLVAFPARLQSDYTKSALEVYRDAVKCVITDRRVFTILDSTLADQASMINPPSAAIPTWTPRWDVRWTRERDANSLDR
jgi:hypothetical protein